MILKLAVNKVKVSAAQSFCKMIDCKSLVKPIQSWKHGEKDNFLMTTRWLSMNRAFIILNQILLSTKALNCNCQSYTVNCHSYSKFLWALQLYMLYTALGGASHDRLFYLAKINTECHAESNAAFQP